VDDGGDPRSRGRSDSFPTLLRTIYDGDGDLRVLRVDSPLGVSRDDVESLRN
jgi:hypothetical protein